MPGSALFRFGLVSDVQYADIDNKVSFHGCPRFYRNSLVALRRCVEAWKQQGVSFGIHLGDIVDGFTPREQSESGLTAVLDVFHSLGRPTHHMLGNHCLYNLPRPRLNERLGIPPAADGGSYYSWVPHPGWRFISLDSYDISLLGWPEDHPRHLAARHTLDTKNPNENKHSPEGMEGLERRFVMFGGGVSDQQLAWLDTQLEEAKASQQAVVVVTHVPLHPDTAPTPCVLWNFEQVLPRLQQSGVVVATFAGHTHQNGYCCDEAGIHHMVLPAVLETPPGRDAYGWVEVCEEGLRVVGVDSMATLVMRHPAAAVAAATAAAAAAAALQQEVVKDKAAAGAQVISIEASAAGKQQQQQQQQQEPQGASWEHASSSKAPGHGRVSIDLTASSGSRVE